jgi:hypothetical protein
MPINSVFNSFFFFLFQKINWTQFSDNPSYESFYIESFFLIYLESRHNAEWKSGSLIKKSENNCDIVQCSSYISHCSLPFFSSSSSSHRTLSSTITHDLIKLPTKMQLISFCVLVFPIFNPSHFHSFMWCCDVSGWMGIYATELKELRVGIKLKAYN